MGFVKDIVRRSVGFNPIGWEQTKRQMRARVEEWLADAPRDQPEAGPEAHPETAPDTLVIVAPWRDTPVPWFTIAIGLMLAERGARVRWVIDDLPYTQNALRHVSVLAAIRHAMKPLEKRFEVRLLSDAPRQALSEADRAEVARLARFNATWELRGEMMQQGRTALVERAMAQSGLAQEHIAGFFAANRAPDFLFTPGGIFGHSGLWMRAARGCGARIGSFDAGGTRAMLVESGGMACQAQDVPRAFRQLQAEAATNPALFDFAYERGADELASRRAGTDIFQYQLADSSAGKAGLENGVLIALNSSWDAAALGPHRAYASNTQWIIGTVRYLLEHSDRPVIVRQHPIERNPLAGTSDDYAALLHDAFGEHDRLHFIAASDPVNSYALMEQVAAVVVHTSTIGMEATALGLPVITGSASYYAQLGFVHFGETEAEYEALLAAALRGELQVTQAMQRDAQTAFYLAQVCRWVTSPFNPANLKVWLARPLRHWSSQENVALAMDALVSGTPVPLAVCRAAFARHRAAQAG